MDATEQPFALHPRLAADTIAVGDWPLCRLLLMGDANYPWFILVPRIAGVSEVHQLGAADRAQLWNESDLLSRWLVAEYAPDKLNIAALGNVVPQLHLHHVARYVGDASWPAPVWGQHAAVPLTAAQMSDVRVRVSRLAGLQPV